MKNRILSNWSLSRILRVIIGVVIISEAIARADVVSGIAGAIFTGIGVFNLGCCGSGICYTPVKTSKGALKGTSYEEVV
ncbi:hypothetical protein ACFGVS_20565 [Mucilaginibacter sp. AW1-7]|jgi:multidrug transporter EmrE-like cation transporter|uniref:hypothetical protein n=1 Tax=Mucilaginibacter sp. AW1-7 TaxID=3349874 RepID=UPI003F7325E3